MHMCKQARMFSIQRGRKAKSENCEVGIYIFTRVIIRSYGNHPLGAADKSLASGSISNRTEEKGLCHVR